jgi:hypothetical protein
MDFDSDEFDRLKQVGAIVAKWILLAAIGAGVVLAIALYYGGFFRLSGE